MFGLMTCKRRLVYIGRCRLRTGAVKHFKNRFYYFYQNFDFKSIFTTRLLYRKTVSDLLYLIIICSHIESSNLPVFLWLIMCGQNIRIVLNNTSFSLVLLCEKHQSKTILVLYLSQLISCKPHNQKHI